MIKYAMKLLEEPASYPSGNKRFESILIVSGIIISFTLLFSAPIWDIDLWWHLATGKYIVANKEIPETDSFSFTTGAYMPPDKEAVLKGYWLAQVIFYLSYKLAGLYGIILLRTSILVSIVLFTYFYARREKADNYITFSLILLCGWFTRYYTGERPQLFSFLFLTLMVFLLDRFRGKSIKGESSPETFFILPSLMLLWANCHRGFPIGVAVMILCWGTEIAFSRRDRRHLRRLTLLVFLGAAASLVNPATYKPYLAVVVFEGSMLQQMTSEYVSPLSISQYGISVWPYWSYLTATALTLLLSLRNVAPSRAAITVFLSFLSLYAFRYIPFFMYTTMPITAALSTNLIRDRQRTRAVIHKLTVPFLILAVIYITFTGYKGATASLRHPVAKYRFPEAGVNFLKQQRPGGNIFNYFEWGGYLIWELYPDYKVFIDGRTLNDKVFNDAMNMMWATPQTPLLLEKYGIYIIMIPERDTFTGEYYSIINYLLKDNRWRLAYMDGTAMIFLRDKK